jgi:HNH endonuclease
MQTTYRRTGTEASRDRLRHRRTRNLGHPDTTVASNSVLGKIALIEIFDGRCAICDGFLGAHPKTTLEDSVRLIESGSGASVDISRINLDHVEPASLGGSDHLLNYAPTHEHCNKARGNRPASDDERRRVSEVQRDYESNGHAQMLGRMLAAARDIDLSPESALRPSDDLEDGHKLAIELGEDSIAFRLEFRRCERHGFHVSPQDPRYCIKSTDPEHSCLFDACTWPFQIVSCHFGGAMSDVYSYPFTVFFDVRGQGHALEIARFMEAFMDR